MKKPTPKEPMLSVAEVAARLGPSVDTIHRWCNQGLIAHRKYPTGSVFIAESEVGRIERESQREPVVKPFPKSSRIHKRDAVNAVNAKNEKGATA